MVDYKVETSPWRRDKALVWQRLSQQPAAFARVAAPGAPEYQVGENQAIAATASPV